MAEKTTRRKTAKAIAADAPSLFVERQQGVWAEYGGVRFQLKELTWQEEERVGAVQGAHAQSVFANHPDSRPELDDFDFQIGDVLMLRLGVHDAEVLDGCPPETAAAIEMAKSARKEMQIGEEKRLVFAADLFNRIDPRVSRALLRKIEELTKLSQSEEIKLVFTSPS